MSSRVGSPIALAGAPEPPWKPAATADFNRDGRPDIVFRNSSTQKIAVWAMSGTSLATVLTPNPDQAVDANWEIVGAQDWNADGDTDFLWYNPVSGKVVLWFMDGSLVRIAGQFTSPPNAGNNNWKVLAMGDYGLGASGLPGTIDIVWLCSALNRSARASAMAARCSAAAVRASATAIRSVACCST